MKWRQLAVAAALFWVPTSAIAQPMTEITSLTSGALTLGPGGSGGQDLGAGDLHLTIRCQGRAYADRSDSSVYLQMRIFVEGQQVASQWFYGYGSVDGVLTATVRAATQDRRVDCEASGPFANASDGGTLQGSGPLNANLIFDAFIPYEWIEEPWDPAEPWSDEQLSEGDHRQFGLGGTSRVTIALNMLNSAVSNDLMLGNPIYGVGESVDYDAETSLSDYPNMGWAAPIGGFIISAARNDWQWGIDKKLHWGYADTSGLHCDWPQALGADSYNAVSRVQVYCRAEAYYPWHSAAPAIDFRYTVTLTFGKNQIEWSVEGCRDGFPAYEGYLNGQALFQHADNQTPSSLFAVCGQTFTEQGVI